MVIEFTGTKKPNEKGQSHYSGYICSREILKHFNDSWIPEYQRDRIENKSKINALKEIFTTNQKIDAIKLNLIGEVEGGGTNKTLRGKIHAIDGQQRLYALKESNVEDYYIPVELYVNLKVEEEADLYYRFNDKGTKLNFANVVLSFYSPLGELLRQVTEDKRFPLPIVKQGNKGINVQTITQVLYWSFHKLQGNIRVSRTGSGHLKNFVNDTEFKNKHDVDFLYFTVKNLAQSYVDIWGTFDLDALAYKRNIFLAWCHVVISNFLQPNGKVDFKTFKAKAYAAPKLLQSSKVQQLCGKLSDETTEMLHDIFMVEFNKKRRGKLPTLMDLRKKAKGDMIPAATAEAFQEEFPL
jgi:hypothetical protein